MQLSPHFTLAEMTVSQNAARAGVSNQPNASQLANLKIMCGVLEKIRAMVGVPMVVSSGLRVLPVNRMAGSLDSSAHVLGLATDCTAWGWTPRKLWIFLQDHLEELGIDQLCLEFDAWVHIGLTDDGNPRHQVKRIGC